MGESIAGSLHVIGIEPDDKDGRMAEQRFVYTNEFSKITGIPGSTITKLLRQGMIRGEKKSGRWIIPESEAHASAVKELAGGSKGEGDRPGISSNSGQTASPSADSYSVAEFAGMTYLTEKGVTDFLKSGRLKGFRNSSGEWRVASANCDVEGIKRLIRNG
ncbi:MAG: hypothetical protein R6U50_10695 [Desulfobacterales bacterium]